MKRSQKDLFNLLEKDYELNTKSETNLFEILMLYFLSTIISITALRYLLGFVESATKADYAFSFFLFLMGVLVFCIASYFTNAKKNIKKEYGLNPNLSISKKVKENFSLAEIQEYYEVASDSFKTNILEVIIRKEIANKLEIKGDCDLNKILLNIEKKVEIRNT